VTQVPEGAARLMLVSGVRHLDPQRAVFDAMLRGWRAQQTARGLKEDTMVPRERLVRRFREFTNEYPWAWPPGHMDEWSRHLAQCPTTAIVTDGRRRTSRPPR
jgi:integrase/recombinase XerC